MMYSCASSSMYWCVSALICVCVCVCIYIHIYIIFPKQDTTLVLENAVRLYIQDIPQIPFFSKF